jgi:hypothetical protein
MKFTIQFIQFFLSIILFVSCGRDRYSPYPDMPNEGEINALTIKLQAYQKA